MTPLRRMGPLRLLAVASSMLSLDVVSAIGATSDNAACGEDAMIVFDASGSMSGTDRLGIATMTTDDLIAAFRKTLGCPFLTELRRLRG